jgi:hypothetical protein
MIRELLTDDDARRSFDVMQELRAHLLGPDEYSGWPGNVPSGSSTRTTWSPRSIGNETPAPG